MKMEEINKIIRDLWRNTYRGQGTYGFVCLFFVVLSISILYQVLHSEKCLFKLLKIQDMKMVGSILKATSVGPHYSLLFITSYVGSYMISRSNFPFSVFSVVDVSLSQGSCQGLFLQFWKKIISKFYLLVGVMSRFFCSYCML